MPTMEREITIEVGDDDVTFDLEVEYNVNGTSSPATYHAWYGWSPPEYPELEIENVNRTDSVHHVEIQRWIEEHVDRIEEWCWEDWETAKLPNGE